jgi:hypothetical protein
LIHIKPTRPDTSDRLESALVYGRDTKRRAFG